MHRFLKQILYCQVSVQQGNWDLHLPICEFALKSTHSASTRVSLAFVVLGHDTTLPLEHALYEVTHRPVQGSTDHISNIQSTLQLVHNAVFQSATLWLIMLISITITIQFLLLWTHLLGCPLTTWIFLLTYLISLLHAMLSHSWLLSSLIQLHSAFLLPGNWQIHDIFHSSQVKPPIGFVYG